MMKPLKFILKWGFFFSIWIAVFATIALFYYFQGLPTLDDLEKEAGKQIVQINYSNGELITNRGEIYANEVNYYELPQNLINALVAIEDRRFFSHFGIDVFGIARAFYVNQKAGRIVQGGSTITQQLAKMLFLSPERTMKRKIQEVLLAIQLERHFSKEQIITFYLNRAYFGSGNYGVNAAAKYYFSKDVAKLNLNESAMLAGVVKSPSNYSPKNNRKKAEERSNLVIKAMIEEGFLGEKNLAELDHDPNYISYRGVRFYFADFVYDQFEEFLEKKSNKEKSVIVTSTLDESLQMKMEDVLAEFIEANNRKLGKSQVAVIVMKKDGALLAMSGGNDYQQSQFNRSVYAKRQAGSAFKTFVYLAAFENGLQLDDVFEDKKVAIGSWLPENYNKNYLGKIDVREAFAESSNSVAVQIGHKVGANSIISTARKMGIISQIPKNDSTIALGTSEVSLLELTTAYATIANDGIPVIPYFITKIENDFGKLLYVRKTSGFDPIISKDALSNIKEVLREVVKSGTGKAANVADNIYGKTGTSQNFRDAWFVGFDDKYVIGIWIGNDDNSPTNKIVGGSLPAKLFGKIIEEI
jgi:penicillin-binding protein 1A